MPHIQEMDRNQMMMCSLDSLVDQESIARVIDAFVEGLDMKKMGFEKVEAAPEGRPGYASRSMLKLYLYGNEKTVRSSRRLNEACRLNVEVKWLMGGLEPDFRTISDFRKSNIDCLKRVFHEFNRRLSKVLVKGFLSVDGSKFRANNAKDNNFTANKLDDRIAWLNQRTDEYLRQLSELDEAEDEAEAVNQFSREELEKKLKEAKERLERYQGYRDYMEQNGLSQISLTDRDAKLMKSRNGFMVAYNVQTAVDSQTHLIEDYQVTNQPTDHGMLLETVSGEKVRRGGVQELVADKGYQAEEDMAKCLEEGIIPNVILGEGQDRYEIEMGYVEKEISEEMKKSETPEDIKDCLHAGIIPAAYKDKLREVEVLEKIVSIEEAVKPQSSPYQSEEEMKGRAGEGYFVRDPERNRVYCPTGEMLRQKSVKKNGTIRYANKTACRHCKERWKCYKGKNDWKEIDFTKDTLEKANREWMKEKGVVKVPIKKRQKKKYELRKIVRMILEPDREKMDQRKCLSEHPFGTIKRAMNAGYYLLCGTKKVAGETALICLGYNLKRAMNLLGFPKMMEIMA